MIYSCTGSFLGGKFVQWYDYLDSHKLYHIKYLNASNNYYNSFFKIEFDFIKKELSEKDILFIDSEYFYPNFNQKLISKIDSDINFKMVIIHKDCNAPKSTDKIKILSPNYDYIEEVNGKFNYYLINAGKNKLRKLSYDFWKINKTQIRFKKFLFTNGTVKPHRTVFYNFLKDTGIIDNSLVSYLGYHVNDEKNNEVFDDTILYKQEFKNPSYLDTTWEVGSPLSEFTPLSLISNCYFDIVSATLFENTDSLFTSEKIFRPFLSFVFPIFISQSGICDLLRSLGFDLFDDFINHSYDTKKNPSERMNLLFKEVDRLNGFSNLELFKIYEKNYKRFENNFNRLELLADVQIKNFKNNIEYKTDIL